MVHIQSLQFGKFWQSYQTVKPSPQWGSEHTHHSPKFPLLSVPGPSSLLWGSNSFPSLRIPPSFFPRNHNFIYFVLFFVCFMLEGESDPLARSGGSTIAFYLEKQCLFNFRAATHMCILLNPHLINSRNLLNQDFFCVFKELKLNF